MSVYQRTYMAGGDMSDPNAGVMPAPQTIGEQIPPVAGQQGLPGGRPQQLLRAQRMLGPQSALVLQ